MEGPHRPHRPSTRHTRPIYKSGVHATGPHKAGPLQSTRAQRYGSQRARMIPTTAGHGSPRRGARASLTGGSCDGIHMPAHRVGKPAHPVTLTNGQPQGVGAASPVEHTAGAGDEMSWVKMDDRWPSNRKLRLVEPADRLMWVMAIAYTSDQRTDGRLDGSMVEYVAFLAGATKPYESADRLVSAGLFDLEAGGWVVHDFLEFNPTAKQTEAKSEARARAGRAGGVKSGETRRARSAGQEGLEANASPVASPVLEANRTPSRPVPSRPDSLRSSTPLRQSPDPRFAKLVNQVAWAQAKISTNGKSVGGLKATIIAKAEDDGLADELERLLQRHPEADVEWLVDEHLGRPHPKPPYVPPDPREVVRALRGEAS